MLAILGFGMITTFMILIMTRRLSAIAALIVVPIVFGLLGGFGVEIGEMAIEGMMTLAPTVVALVFAVLYFSIMIDAGLFDPLVNRALAFAKGDPLRVTIATVTVASVISLDGDGATTAIVTIGGFLPIYRRLGMNPLILAVLLGMSNSIINIAPWGGPTLRVASALQVDIMEVFLPLLPVMAIGLAGAFAIAVFLGLSERRRVGICPPDEAPRTAVFDRPPEAVRPHLFWLNLALTLALLGSILAQLVPLPLAVMVGLAIAMLINYPRISDQRDRIAAHAANALPIALLIFAAAVFTGILNGTGMVDAMGESLLALIPDRLGPYMGALVAATSGPFTFVMSNDAYYFGIVPVLAESAGHFGVTPVEIARASLLGQTLHSLSPLIAAIYLVAGLLKVEVGDLQRFGLPFALALNVLMVVAALVIGVVPFVAS